MTFSLALHGQVIRERFDKLTVSENFDSISTYWTTLANADNLFIVQDGEYILQRRAKEAPYAIIAGFEEEFVNFRVVTSMKLDKSMSENAYMGLLFSMQKNGQGGFLFEINKKKEYRLRQISGGNYKYLSGSARDGGWTKSTLINEPNTSNMIEIKCFNRNYDIYTNGTFLRSVTEPSYSSGKMGIIIGPESFGKVDFMYIFTKASPAESAAQKNAQNKEPEVSSSTAPDIIELAESIITLKTQINRLQEENDELKRTMSALKSGDQDRDLAIRNHEKTIKSLQDQVKARDLTLDSLRRSNTELEKYREIIGGNANGDVIINLSKALKAEKEKNLALESELKELRGSKPAPDKSKPEPEKSSGNPGNSSGTRTNSNVLSLPGDR
jgi:hypothetical protein